MGLRTKLLLVWFLLLLAPLSILGGIGYFYIDTQLRQDALHYQTDVTRSVSSAADDYLTRFGADTAAAAQSAELDGLLTETASVPDSASLQRLLRTFPGVLEYRLLGEHDFARPSAQASRGPSLALDISGLQVNSSTMATGAMQLFHLRNESGEKGYLVALAAINEAQSGYLAAIAELDSLVEMLASQPHRDTSLLLVDGAGELLAANGELNSKLSAVGRALPAGVGRSMGDFRYGGSSYLLVSDPLSQGFQLISLTDNAILFARKLPYIIVFVLALSLTLLFSGVVFNFIVNEIAIKPVQQLIRATRQIAKGDLNPELEVGSKDELGELAIAFRQMGQQLQHTSRRIRQLAYYDPLTQLPNRTTLRETLSRLLARADKDKWKAAVLFIDLDDFKKVNDRLGHEAGDELLVQISHRLKNRLRQADLLFEQAGVASVDQLISRRGGDEFNAVLTRIKSSHDAALVAERIIQDLNQPFYVNKSEIHVGASVGVAIFPDDGKDADALLRNADLAMYEAKAKGKNNYHIFTSAINDQVHQRLALENALQTAMTHSQFCLYYQPKVSLVDMSPVGFEALVRWRHPEKGIILPSKFIPVAEESNLIRDIGNWVLGESMQQVQLWDKVLPKQVRIAINISARQLAQTDLVDQLHMMMEHFQISPQRLEIELTETSVLHDENTAIQHLKDLRQLGVEVSLDDFGTGYSSLSFLRKLPIDTVKIDRSFTANVTQNGEARAIVISLLNLCKELKVKTIAEGIETTEQLQFLMEHGCDQGQGFLFSKPLPSHKVMAFLEEPSYLALS